MEAPLVRDCSTFILNFAHQPPRLVRWGFHRFSKLRLLIGATPEGIVCRVSFVCERDIGAAIKKWEKSWPSTKFVKDKSVILSLLAWMKGHDNPLKVQMTGTSFQHKVWREIARIPLGQTQSYGDIARRIKNPKACRAIGTACGANPVPVIVPCHRVIASHGKLGGFAGGLELKKRMLQAEGQTCR